MFCGGCTRPNDQICGANSTMTHEHACFLVATFPACPDYDRLRALRPPRPVCNETSQRSLHTLHFYMASFHQVFTGYGLDAHPRRVERSPTPGPNGVQVLVFDKYNVGAGWGAGLRKTSQRASRRDLDFEQQFYQVPKP